MRAAPPGELYPDELAENWPGLRGASPGTAWRAGSEDARVPEVTACAQANTVVLLGALRSHDACCW